MNRYDYFHTNVAKLYFDRTRFHAPFQHTTAFNVGDIVPLEVEEIYPGDGLNSHLSFLIRSFTPIAPQMSNMYLDVYSFFVPYRIVWEHWENFYGQNDTSAWTSQLEYVIPAADVDPDNVKLDSVTGFLPESGTLADYLGIVIGDDSSDFDQNGDQVSDLYRRAYLKIYNDWFRDENWQAPILFGVGDSVLSGEDYTYWSPLLTANKFHDYFTAVLPDTQKGTPVDVGGYGPVVVGADHLTQLVNPETPAGTPVYGLNFVKSQTGQHVANVDGQALRMGGSLNYTTINTNESGTAGDTAVTPSNLWAQWSVTIEDIRNAAVVQHVLEALANSGSRYPEALIGLWGVRSSDARLQIPEYLGGERFPLNNTEVISTANTVSGGTGEYLGQNGAMLKVSNGSGLFNTVFQEHGMLFTVGVVRIEQTYFEGLHRRFSRKSFFDFYMPQLANIGYQPIYSSELIYNDSTDSLKQNVYGFAEAWQELRFSPYRLSSIMRPGVAASLSYYTATDEINGELGYSNDDVTPAGVIPMGKKGFDRTIAVPSATRGAFQLFGDFKFDNIWTRILPAHSKPGLTRI